MQNRALHFLASFVGLRMAVVPELNHPKWNCWQRAVEHSGMEYDLMRLTVAANYPHGTKMQGERASNRRLFLKTFLHKQNDQWFSDIAEEICMDKGRSIDSMDVGTCRYMIEDFLESPSIRKRGDYDSWIISENTIGLFGNPFDQ